MVLGHKGHGKTTVAHILDYRFDFAFADTTNYVKSITLDFINANPQVTKLSSSEFLEKFNDDKDSVRDLMKLALDNYTENDPTRFIRDRLEHSDVYAGCRSAIQFEQAKPLLDVIFWVRNDNLPEDDPTMEIAYDPSCMILLNNSGTKTQLERNIKGELFKLAGVPIRTYDRCLRDSLVSSLETTQKLPTITE